MLIAEASPLPDPARPPVPPLASGRTTPGRSCEEATVTLDLEHIRRMPKVVLHEHLDGGLRAATIVELAREQDVDLPTTDPEALDAYLSSASHRGSLADYLRAFHITTAVMQTGEALERVAYESLADLHADGVVYAEIRFAPVFHTQGGLNLEQVMNAVLRGLERASSDFALPFGLIVCAMRDRTDSLSMAELAVLYRDRGCVGLDLAGEEAGHPPKSHLDAFHLIQRENFNITIHAGESFGLHSIWQALQYCGAHRIGHATRLVDDIVIKDGEVVQLGQLATYVRDKRIPLEICLSSNLHTGAVRSISEHPFRYLHDMRFRVTLNTDNRLMSATTQSDELHLAAREFALGLADLEKLVINGMKSAFIHYDARCRVIYEVIKPGFEAIRIEPGQAHAS
jgi:adenosine deaminase